jgi:hypothetical protein
MQRLAVVQSLDGVEQAIRDSASAGLHSDKPSACLSTSGSRLFVTGLVKVSSITGYTN